MNAFHVRSATSSDAEMLSHIAARTFSDTFGHLYPQQDLETYLAKAYAVDKMQEQIDDSDMYTVFIFSNKEAETPCGFSMLWDGSIRPGDDDRDTRNHLEFKRFYIMKEYHGTGAAGVLMKHVMQVIRQKQRQVVWLIVWENNLRAHNFYKKYGFQETGEHF
ncbi:hypothetical protein Poli38472_005188 [Pythium oligandrum]|uniref:N-acetyltransferase domain-containing protein n=1 Tax=Pythium oligandrum TaxID=41045 RepID=A0A8K1CH16_PYTOL|nr:hypothetical protein Poli38472_005188 [Pythium oligandrum]|eukprot:TMW62570.1 hypothetical protein Poli38472_005188 [Pythium oligandrum]